MNRTIFSPILLLLLVAAFGCSGNSPGSSPVVPDTQDIDSQLATSQQSQNGHVLFGLWDFCFDPDTEKMEIVAMRNAQFHVNIVWQLQDPKPLGLSILVHGWDPDQAILDVDLSIHHPYPYTNFRAFDTRGIFMGTGYKVPGKLDPTATYSAPGSFRILNADGYTRWWNALEFTTPGFFGYQEGAIGFKDFTPDTTINGYKYFADVLSSTDPVVPKVNMVNRGTFSINTAPPSVTRNYQIQFPKPGGATDFHFQYAVDVNWWPPNGANPVPEPVEDFPMDANCPEAFHIRVSTDGTTAYYDDGVYGGNVVLSIEVFDWNVPSNPDGIAAEIGSIWVESPSLFNQPVSVDLDPLPGSQPTSGIFNVIIPDVTPLGLENQEVLVTVRSANPTTYAPPGIADYPAGAALAAYALVDIPISGDIPQDAYITISSPNGGEVWVPGSSKYIKWTSVGNTGYEVKISYTVDDGAPVNIINSTDNDGSYIWTPIPNIESDLVKVHIESIQEPDIKDSSDNYFEITANPDPKITVTSPNGGETWTCANSGTVTWDSVGLVGYEVRIDYTINDGSPQNIVAQTNNDGTYIWNPIPDIDSDKVKIVVTSFINPAVKDASDEFFTISCGSTESGWNPVSGKTLVPLTSPPPYQFEQPTDLAVFSAGANKSRGEIIGQATEDHFFYKYNDAYDYLSGAAWMYPSDIGPVHKFDALPDASRIFVTSAEDAPWYPPTFNDPTYAVFSTHNNTTGAGEYFLIGDSGEPSDPDNERWMQAVDWSCGIPGGIDDTEGYLFMANSPLWTKTPHDGNIVLLYWDTPYDVDSVGGFWIDASTQGGGTGEVNDTNPYVMAIAADDRSHVTIDEINELPVLWVLDTTGTATCFVCVWDTTDVIVMQPQFDSAVWGAYGTPVDIEIANARDFGYQYSETSDFNWLCALLDNGDGTWSVGVWEYDFLWTPDLAKWNLVDVTDTLNGYPMAVDVDPVDFEIHVLSDNAGTVEATVFDFTPE